MPTRIAEREMSRAERDFLQQIWQKAPGPAQRWVRGTQNALILWLVSTLVVILVWRLLAWAAHEMFQTDIGGTAAVAAWAAPICAVLAVVSSILWVRGWPNPRPRLEADLASGRIAEEHYRFIAARRFQEPEYGGLIYFLRTIEGRVMVFFDHESQDLGAQGEDPLGSRFKPRAELLMVRAPRARYVIGKHFSGELLEAGEPAVLTLDPREWPDSEEYCDIPWEELDARLSAGAPAPGVTPP